MTDKKRQPEPVDFFTAVKIAFNKYAEFEGRATRPEFWWFILFTALVSSALGALSPSVTYGMVTTTGSGLASAWAVATFLPTLAAAVRRLRDAGRRWTNMFWLFVPIAGLIIIVIYLCEPPKLQGAKSQSSK